jgi:hypothetical protein
MTSVIEAAYTQQVAVRDARIAELAAENDRLRRLLASSNADCPYCGLPAADMAKCASGFPGCGRADDMMTS